MWPPYLDTPKCEANHTTTKKKKSLPKNKFLQIASDMDSVVIAKLPTACFWKLFSTSTLPHMLQCILSNFKLNILLDYFNKTRPRDMTTEGPFKLYALF